MTVPALGSWLSDMAMAARGGRETCLCRGRRRADAPSGTCRPSWTRRRRRNQDNGSDAADAADAADLRSLLLLSPFVRSPVLLALVFCVALLCFALSHCRACLCFISSFQTPVQQSPSSFLSNLSHLFLSSPIDVPRSTSFLRP